MMNRKRRPECFVGLVVESATPGHQVLVRSQVMEKCQSTAPGLLTKHLAAQCHKQHIEYQQVQYTLGLTFGAIRVKATTGVQFCNAASAYLAVVGLEGLGDLQTLDDAASAEDVDDGLLIGADPLHRLAEGLGIRSGVERLRWVHGGGALWGKYEHEYYKGCRCPKSGPQF